MADSLYIKHLEKLLKEKTEENEALKKENERLAKNFVFHDPLEEIRSLADCVAAIDFNELLYFDSAKRLLLQIIEICDEEMKMPYIEKSSASAGTETEQKKI